MLLAARVPRSGPDDLALSALSATSAVGSTAFLHLWHGNEATADIADGADKAKAGNIFLCCSPRESQDQGPMTWPYPLYPRHPRLVRLPFFICGMASSQPRISRMERIKQRQGTFSYVARRASPKIRAR